MKRKIEVGIVREYDYYQVILPVKLKYPKDYKRHIFKSDYYFNSELTRAEIEQLLEKYREYELVEVNIILTLFDNGYLAIPESINAKWLTDKQLRYALSWWTPTLATTSSWFDLDYNGRLVSVEGVGFGGTTCERRMVTIEDTEILKINNRSYSDYLIAGLYQKSVRE